MKFCTTDRTPKLSEDWSPQRYAQPRLSTASDVEPPGTSTINEAPYKGQAGVWVTYVQLVIPKLTSKLTRDIGFQVAGIPASVHQVGWPNANKLFEAQQRLPISHIHEFLAITYIVNVGKVPKKAVNIIPAQQLANRGHISQQPRTSLKSTEKHNSDTFWRLLSGLDNGRAVKGEPCHQISV